MRICWNPLDFKHDCGATGIIHQVFVSQDGCIKINGVCAVCARDFSTEDTMAALISKSAIDDYKHHYTETPEEQLLNFIEQGYPT